MSIENMAFNTNLNRNLSCHTRHLTLNWVSPSNLPMTPSSIVNILGCKTRNILSRLTETKQDYEKFGVISSLIMENIDGIDEEKINVIIESIK
jgi:hypothetical protein